MKLSKQIEYYGFFIRQPRPLFDHLCPTEQQFYQKNIKMMSLCEFPVRQKWGLIYRASKDGFEFLNFELQLN